MQIGLARYFFYLHFARSSEELYEQPRIYTPVELDEWEVDLFNMNWKHPIQFHKGKSPPWIVKALLFIVFNSQWRRRNRYATRFTT